MALQVRRVVTGHDGNGRAIVKDDRIMDNLVVSRPGSTWANIWVGSSRVDLQACKLEYSIVSPK